MRRLSALLLLLACQPCGKEIREPEAAVEVYFAPYQDVRGVIVSLLNSAEDYLLIAIYELEHPDIVRAITSAKKRGVDVKVVMDDRMKGKWAHKKLKDAGIPVVFDNRKPYMHNKFVVVDGKVVLTGSANFKRSSLHKNDNNVVVVYSKEVASNYEKEFYEMFRDREFGPDSPKNTHCCFKVGDVYLEVYFSPEDNPEERMISLLRGAKKEIAFAAFAFTDDELGQAVLQAFKRGVEVRGVVEKRAAKGKHSEFPKFKRVGMNVILDKNPYNMHSKYFIIDDSIVVTGSYNFSKSAQLRNDENVILIFSKEIAKKYKENFEYLLGTSL